tara:strand:- start:1092 stop:1445 length:354 start_codon:yes stop_codon:yes gene_type:complete
MIAVQVFGKIKNKKSVIEYAENVLCDVGKNITELLEVDIKFVTQLSSGDYGYCLGDEEYAEIVVAKNIEGVPVPYREMMVTLAHELVHAKQFAFNEECCEIECHDKEESLFEKHWKN